MRYQITLNMPSRSGALVHQITCEHPAETLQELVNAMDGEEFIIVEEFYKNNAIPAGEKDHITQKGPIALSTMQIGKITMEGR